MTYTKPKLVVYPVEHVYIRGTTTCVTCRGECLLARLFAS